jgi:hypothetical protein
MCALHCKLAKQLENLPEQLPKGDIFATPFVVSDRKGRLLRDQVRSNLESAIKWEIIPGATTDTLYEWLLANLDNLLSTYSGKLSIYVGGGGGGLRDITVNRGKFIDLRDK